MSSDVLSDVEIVFLLPACFLKDHLIYLTFHSPFLPIVTMRFVIVLINEHDDDDDDDDLLGLKVEMST